MAECKSCKQPIVWVKTVNGRMMPCDPKEVVVVTEDGQTVKGRISHWATCVSADQHRRPREDSSHGGT